LEGNVRQHRKVEQLKEGGAEMQPQMNRMRLPEQQMMAADSSFDMQEERMTFPKNFHLEWKLQELTVAGWEAGGSTVACRQEAWSPARLPGGQVDA
jgi:hypothetical protein